MSDDDQVLDPIDCAPDQALEILRLFATNVEPDFDEEELL